ncbi:hypothetical protein BDB00DRAFT_786379 [Zychaea mexicana]|uniref:uncharacterized protein n=1 Tax=Zychaea mexicana TaxID=64656 RepID=UPI0022FEC3A8|nr:uncharacterized protein BDB00DRAFT_786379 [Zychaea mexicana]KAI9495291.1 hypothetical protein BDB00DRAFT_786379 [Zychaea mexicana]
MPGNNHKQKPSDRRDSLKQQQRKNSAGVNGFNSAEVVQFLNQRFSDTLTAYHDTNAEASTRPVKYESQEKAWGGKGGLPSVWGQKNGAMATGADLFSEMLKTPHQQQQQQQ